jgi:DNA invertase Pin-like site-specific DNA recombinase
MNIGYARTSTVEQIAGFEAQIKELKQAGCERIYKEQVSSIAARDQLEAAIEFAQEGDVLTVTKLDRLARSVADVMVIIKALKHKNVGLRILNLGMDTSTPTGSLMVTILSGVAQFEREIMLERQREGIAKAKAAGNYKGRKPIAPDVQQEIINLANNKVSKVKIAHQLGIGEATVYRVLKKDKNTPKNTFTILDNTVIPLENEENDEGKIVAKIKQ